MKNSRTSFLFGVGLISVVGCTNAVEDRPAPEPPPADLAEPLTGDWDESRAPAAEPCGRASIETCESATSGVCGMISSAETDECLPLFNWGVTADGRVQFGSSERLFFLDDLVATPLSAVERREADFMAVILASPDEEDHGHEPGDESESGSELQPLALTHSGYCSTSYLFCNESFMYRFHSHYNGWRDGVYRHIHKLAIWKNASYPYYYCNSKGSFWSYPEYYCGTP